MNCSKEFFAFYPEVKECISQFLNGFTVDWVQKHCIDMLEYSTKGGKMLRGIMTAAVYLELTGYSPDSEEAKVGYYLGWVEEIIHAGYLIADDLMDQSETRRGQECWYKREEIGDQAVNDGLILQDLAYVLLDKIRNKLNTKYYAKLIEFSRKIGTYTTIGQTYDFIAKIPSFQEYNQIVTYKTAFYTVVSPIVFWPYWKSNIRC
ncbi:dimethylallyltranstransferase protein [Trichomonas vaginalis G3]|uniref:dimethylallyltranstransferase protein n=1 Tax=Trichomonas vaginalis (strain ATCC PRA-98 / G3) TaxID=412133 RepID=UPI0021E62680|nr:dimethylallyltranstransferase protein [Trichomonas vaginalis G3]KAI5529936.1 dimethylallyltranstransferase protein [Trichomonas vaginalis G3]